MLLMLFLLPVRASELARAVGADQVTGAAREYLDGYLDAGELTGKDWSSGAATIVQKGAENLPGILTGAMRSGVLLLAVAMLCGLSESVREELGSGGLDPIRLAGAGAVTAIAVSDVNTLMGLGREALGQMDLFSKALLPTVTAAGAAAGMPAAAVARQGVTLLFLGLLLTAADRLILPVVYAYVAAEAACTALDNGGLKRLAGLLKWGATGMLTLLLTGFTFYLTISGAVAGNADAMSQKAAKTVLSGMIPVVGGILSDAAETVVAGAGVVKGTVGVVGLLTVLAICVGPFLCLGAHYLVYKMAAALTATVTPGPTADLIDAIGSAFALILGMVGGGGMILYIALITSIKAVGGG